jgi:hypothetical protein
VRLRLPPLVGYLLAGIVVGPFTPGFVADAKLAPQQLEEIAHQAAARSDGRKFRELVDEDHTVPRLKVRQVRARKLAQLALICLRALLEDRKGVLRLVPLDQRELDLRQVS